MNKIMNNTIIIHKLNQVRKQNGHFIDCSPVSKPN